MAKRATHCVFFQFYRSWPEREVLTRDAQVGSRMDSGPVVLKDEPFRS
jgi:hypothetical protein